MRAEQQYIDLFSQCEAIICKHSAEVLNAPSAQAFADFERLGFPTRKQEKYKYIDASRRSINTSMQVSCLSLIMA